MSHVGPRLVADVAHALLRAVSRLISTPALLFDTVCESCARTGRREESRRGTQECVRHVGDNLPHMALAVSTSSQKCPGDLRSSETCLTAKKPPERRLQP